MSKNMADMVNILAFVQECLLLVFDQTELTN